jgi:hypothetical protein
MGKCERLEKCPFFNDKLANMPKTAELIKKNNCLSDPQKCARYIVFKAGLNVPQDLFPYDLERAEKILGKR